MNSSWSRAADRRADAFQSIVSTSSPGWYGREPAMSEPVPLRALCIAPNARPTRRRRGTSGNVCSRSMERRTALRDRWIRGDGVCVPGRLRPRHPLEALAPEAGERVAPADRARLGEERGREDDAVPQHRQEEHLDVLRRDV